MAMCPTIHHALFDRDYPDVVDGACCIGAAVMGPGHCTCWERVYDADQAEPRVGEPAATRARMCADCAFRPNSPEKRDCDNAVADSATLAAIVHDPAQTFWCHDGMRSVVAEQHPSGARVERPPIDGVVAYDPPIIDGIPYRADGSPGLRCAGLAAARRAGRAG